MAKRGLIEAWMQIFKRNYVPKTAGSNPTMVDICLVLGSNPTMVDMCLSLTFPDTELPKQHAILSHGDNIS